MDIIGVLLVLVFVMIYDLIRGSHDYSYITK